MASAVDICNIALSHLGARAQVSAISPPDGSVEAGYCARFYPLARREVLEAMNFSFAKTRAQLAEVANDSTVWTYAYALPSDCIRPLRVLKLEYAQQIALIWPIGYRYTDGEWLRIEDSFSERGSATFEIEGQVLRTNEPEAVLLYKKDVTDTTRLSPLAVSAIGQVLAGYLAGPIIKGLEGAKVGDQWRTMGFATAAKAVAADANGSNESSEHVPNFIAARL